LECGGKQSATPLLIASRSAGRLESSGCDHRVRYGLKRRRRCALPAHCYVNVKVFFNGVTRFLHFKISEDFLDVRGLLGFSFPI